MKQIPEKALSYKKTKIFTGESVPGGLLKNHRTVPGVWGKITVLQGRLTYCIEESGESIELNTSKFGVIEPEVLHHVEPGPNSCFYVEFFK